MQKCKSYYLTVPNYKMFLTDRFRPITTTEKFGKEIIFYEKVGSTNDEAKIFAQQGKQEGLVVLCDTQTDGRGRLGRKWHSPCNSGLYFSLLLRPPIPVIKISQLTLLAGVALVETIQEETSTKAQLKWPNDLLINGRKVCGILMESSVRENKIEFVVIGIGVNLNNERDQFDDILRQSATSLKIEGGEDIDRNEFLGSLLHKLETRYKDFLKSGNKRILQFWRENNSTLGKKVTIAQRPGLITGIAEDIDDNGSLVVLLEDGKRKKIFSGEIY